MIAPQSKAYTSVPYQDKAPVSSVTSVKEWMTTGMAPGGVSPHPPMLLTELVKSWLSWSNPDWVGPSKMANANILFNKTIRVGQTSTLTDSSRSYLNIDWLELVIPQHWPTRVGQTSTLTDSSRPNLNIDRLESVKPQHWPTRASQTSTLTDSSRSNVNIDRLESVKPQHWPTGVGQTSTLTDSSPSNLNVDRRELIKFAFTPPPNYVPLEPSLDDDMSPTPNNDVPMFVLSTDQDDVTDVLAQPTDLGDPNMTSTKKPFNNRPHGEWVVSKCNIIFNT